MQLVARTAPDAARRPTDGPFLGVLLLCSLCLTLTGCDIFQDPTPPPSPTSLSANSQDEAIGLEWTSVQIRDLVGFNVYRSTSSIENVSNLDPINGGDLVPRTTYTDTTVENKTTYRYVVTAVDDAGNESAPSGEVEKTPFSKPPGRPP